jgi:carboxyl-terminal processing protease
MTRLSLATTAAILAFGAGVALAPVLAQDKAEHKSPSDKSELYQQLNLFGDVLERVRRDYVEPVDEKTLMEMPSRACSHRSTRTPAT